MSQAESPGLRRKLSSLSLHHDESELLEDHDQLVRGIDLATWKVLLKNTKIARIRSAREVESTTRLQTNTLEIYDGDSPTAEELNAPSLFHMSPLLSPFETQRNDHGSPRELTDRPTLMIWPDPSTPDMGVCHEEDGNLFWDNEPWLDQEASNFSMDDNLSMLSEDLLSGSYQF